MQIHPLGAKRRTGRHEEANSHFSQSCERAQKLPPKMMYILWMLRRTIWD
jgi:hypothetical protein